MFGAPPTTGLTLTKVISGLSKTLSIANQVIPLYKEAKPMINNARTILSALKEFNKPNSSSVKQTTSTPINNANETIKKETTNLNNPRFFI